MSMPIELSRLECLELLQGGVVGRVAISTPLGPRIVPVNYAMHGEEVVVRTSPFSELGTHAPDNQVAFEIDDLDLSRHQGWSVVVVGRASYIEDPDEIYEIRRTWEPRPWADGQRNLFLRIVPREVSGRQLGTDWSRSTMMPVRRVL